MRRAVLLFIAGALTAPAHDLITTKITWSAEISRIVYRRCVSCHRDGGSAPMPLITYEQSRPWAKAIRDEVLSRHMPPWGAVRGYGDLKHDGSLTQDEMMRIAEWVEGGAPEGDPKYLPPTVPQPPATGELVAGRRTRVRRFTTATTVLALRPLADVAGAKIYARRSDGGIEPLLWLNEYKHRWNHTFEFAAPKRFPAGTRIISEPPVPFELVVR